jgi:hypothetical protein
VGDPIVSVYEPVVVMIDGQEFQVRKRSRAVLRQLAQLQAKLDAAASDEAKIDYGYEQLGLLIDAPQEVIDGLDAGQVARLSSMISDLMAEKSKAGDAGKNPARPGDEKPAA